MNTRSLDARLQDILTSIGHIEKAISGKSFEDYKSEPILRLAVERALEIISEASRYLPETEKEKYPVIPWQEVKAIGNILRHAYQGVDPEIIWTTVTLDLGPLKQAVEAMLVEEEKKQK
jgi:uncharacterized protein with HEPN domain